MAITQSGLQACSVAEQICMYHGCQMVTGNSQGWMTACQVLATYSHQAGTIIARIRDVAVRAGWILTVCLGKAAW